MKPHAISLHVAAVADTNSVANSLPPESNRAQDVVLKCPRLMSTDQALGMSVRETTHPGVTQRHTISHHILIVTL
jgi:hypothetical protein